MGWYKLHFNPNSHINSIYSLISGENHLESIGIFPESHQATDTDENQFHDISMALRTSHLKLNGILFLLNVFGESLPCLIFILPCF